MKGIREFLTLRQTLYHLYLQDFQPMLRELALTQMEADILLFLANNPQYDTAAELVNIRHLAKSQVSVAVERLARRGYLRREPEGRRQHLRLLDAAAPAVERGRACQMLFAQQMLADFTPEETEVLAGLLDRLAENVRRAAGEGNGDGTAL